MSENHSDRLLGPPKSEQQNLNKLNCILKAVLAVKPFQSDTEMQRPAETGGLSFQRFHCGSEPNQVRRQTIGTRYHNSAERRCGISHGALTDNESPVTPLRQLQDFSLFSDADFEDSNYSSTSESNEYTPLSSSSFAIPAASLKPAVKLSRETSFFRLL